MKETMAWTRLRVVREGDPVTQRLIVALTEAADRGEVLEAEVARLTMKSEEQDEFIISHEVTIEGLIADLRKAEAEVARLHEEGDAMQRRAEAAESDWQETQRYKDRSEQSFGELQRLFGLDEIGDDPTDFFVIVENKFKALKQAEAALAKALTGLDAAGDRLDLGRTGVAEDSAGDRQALGVAQGHK
jgi:chromosome segregation ATPase